MIAIIDYQMGNLRSVQKGFEKVGHEATITSDPDVLAAADKVVLPGVGAFGDAMAELKRRELVEPIRQAVASGKPFLGHLPGAAIAVRRGLRRGPHEGLGILPGEVVRFELPARIQSAAHGLEPAFDSPAGARCWPDSTRACTATSCTPITSCRSDPAVIATETNYPKPFCSMIWRDNLFATQFHPEKSQRDGLRMLKNFAEL